MRGAGRAWAVWACPYGVSVWAVAGAGRGTPPARAKYALRRRRAVALAPCPPLRIAIGANPGAGGVEK